MTSVWKRLQRVGKKASKFQFIASYQELVVEFTKKWQPDKLRVVWTRRNRRMCSKLHSWQPGIKNPYRGVVMWPVPENVDISVTLFKEANAEEFEDKDWTFVIEGESKGHRKVLASADINMKKLASPTPTQTDLTLKLKPLSVKVVEATLKLSLSCVFLREGRATDEDMQSVASLMSVKPSDVGNMDDFNESDEDEDKKSITATGWAPPSTPGVKNMPPSTPGVKNMPPSTPGVKNMPPFAIKTNAAVNQSLTQPQGSTQTITEEDEEDPHSISSLKEDGAQINTPPTARPIMAKEPDVVTTSGAPGPPRVGPQPPSEPPAPRAMDPPAAPPAMDPPAPPAAGPGAAWGSSTPGTQRTSAEAAGESAKDQPAEAASEGEGPLWAALEEPVAVDAGGGGRTREGLRREEDQQEEGDKDQRDGG